MSLQQSLEPLASISCFLLKSISLESCDSVELRNASARILICTFLPNQAYGYLVVTNFRLELEKWVIDMLRVFKQVVSQPWLSTM